MTRPQSEAGAVVQPATATVGAPVAAAELPLVERHPGHRRDRTLANRSEPDHAPGTPQESHKARGCSPTAVHEAAKDDRDGRTVFVLEHGDMRLVGQVESEDEYRAYLAVFQGWRGVTLPSASRVDLSRFEGSP